MLPPQPVGRGFLEDTGDWSGREGVPCKGSDKREVFEACVRQGGRWPSLRRVGELWEALG